MKFKFRLKEDLNTESTSLTERLGLNAITSKYLRDKVLMAIKGDSEDAVVSKEKMSGQTALLKFFICNYNISKETDICVHHINFRHDDYRRENLCVLPKTCHDYIHNKMISEKLSEALLDYKLNKKAYKNKKKIEIKDLDTWFDYKLFTENLLQYYNDYVNNNRLDK